MFKFKENRFEIHVENTRKTPCHLNSRKGASFLFIFIILYFFRERDVIIQFPGLVLACVLAELV